jgi:prepilin-type N-terminal cleavage/methylation domain-containing protein
MARRRPDDAGFSLVEVMVTMGIMSVLMALFTTAVLQVYRASVTSESLSTAQSQLQVAFQRFDRELRYASWVAQPGKVGDTWYVEFAGYDRVSCLQLRLETRPAGAAGSNDGRGVLQLVRWPLGTPPAAGKPGQTIASTLVTDDGVPPFELQNPGTQPYASPSPSGVGAEFKPDLQRLRIRLKTRVGPNTAQVDTTFTALNTTHDTPKTTHGCSEGRPAP